MLSRHNAMHIRYATQRQHIVDSLDALLYQLHVLSFLLAPSIVTLFVRAAGQFQLSHPREFGPRRTLRFRFMLIFLFNAGSFWNHVISSTPHGRSVVLDFVGMAFTPPRTQLLLLDLLIIALSVIVTTVAYETAYARAVTKAAIRATLDLTPTLSSPAAHTYADPLDRGRDDDSDMVVLDLRASLLLRHVRRPPPPPPDDAPLPNGATIVEGLRVLLQAQRSFGARRQTPPAAGSGDGDAQTQAGERVQERRVRVPGGMDPPEDS
ncbi:hypothetical protein BJY52DRAFT_1151785 [Lactarius psammicola]|nr:hypothetical protein BJY52DRAFT_1151785 [Lactarius psammicola]